MVEVVHNAESARLARWTFVAFLVGYLGFFGALKLIVWAVS